MPQAVVMARKHGFTVTKTPMSSLVQGAKGNLHRVKINSQGIEDADGFVMHCIQDAIKYVGGVSADRASDIWRKEVSDDTKAKLSRKNEIVPTSSAT